jgi:hypothetical protein
MVNLKEYRKKGPWGVSGYCTGICLEGMKMRYEKLQDNPYPD